MDRKEKIEDHVYETLQVLSGFQTTLWTAMPARIISFDPERMSCSAQITIQGRVQTGEQSWEWVDMPPLVDCPVVFPGGGGVILTFPINPGDEVLVVFASRCIDNWWVSGGIRNQAELRMHDLSDGFCIPGPRSLPNVPGGISTAKATLRSDSGGSQVSIDPASGDVEVISSGAVTVQAGIINLNGAVIINGTPFNNHTHTGVSTGGSNTGGVS